MVIKIPIMALRKGFNVSTSDSAFIRTSAYKTLTNMYFYLINYLKSNDMVTTTIVCWSSGTK